MREHALAGALLDRQRRRRAAPGPDLDPRLKSYLWAYPAGIDWFMNLHEAGGSLLAEVLCDGYQRPLSPGEIERRWPSGPRSAGTPELFVYGSLALDDVVQA